ncbi:LysE family transporter [Lacrimispora sp. NSJ-141]|uniref:LysE family transporter n=1 Tax=Lientehia hominis TaxID=2897778 RepID=A0AAP2W8M1_9FIRM|nr:LysE family transporter [Lientehia hominis]MCD2492355.1 LysE family transporter [Lientehia hominis]
MASYLLKGILIGLLFGLPAGAIGAMTVQRTWSFGFKAGLLTGLGSSAADCLYAVIGAFGFTLVSDFLLQRQTIINILGGGLILMMGLRLICKKSEICAAQVKAAGKAGMFLSSFVIGIANPAAILTFLFAFSYFGIAGVAEPTDGISLVCGVFIGTYLWWGTLSAAACAVKKKTGSRSLRYMNKVFGWILVLFGTASFFRLLL